MGTLDAAFRWVGPPTATLFSDLAIRGEADRLEQSQDPIESDPTRGPSPHSEISPGGQ